MKKLTVAVCSYNRAARLPLLIQKLREQECPIPFEILVVDNNSKDNTQEVLAGLAIVEGAALRWVKECKQGIPFARNRAIDESLCSDYLLFIDDDELPSSNMLVFAMHSLEQDDAECVGGRVVINFGDYLRPAWLTDDLLPFYAELDYGKNPFWITSHSTPIWTSIVAYQTKIFKNDPNLRFDLRYNREGAGIGGGEDGIMFKTLLANGVKIQYQPGMVVEHFIDGWKIKRSYFLKLHFIAGCKHGQFQMEKFERSIFGIPPFLILQFFKLAYKPAANVIKQQPGTIRLAMTASYTLGSIWGCFLNWWIAKG